MMVSAPLLGHLLPMVPLADALRDAGHEVILVAGGDALSVRQTGLEIEDVAGNIHIGRIAGGILIRHPMLGRAELAGRAGTRVVSLLFGAINKRMIPAVLGLAERFRPDVVVHEPLAVAGAVAAARLDVPAVLHENSLFDGPELVAATAVRIGSYSTAVPPNAAVITIAPPSVVGVRPGWPMSGIPFAGLGELPAWLRKPSGSPRILVSRSTVAGPASGNLMGAVVAVAGQVDAEFVLVRPGKVARRRLPGNVRMVDWIPLNQALPHCTAVVHHGGAGSVLGALAAGKPQLAVPGAGDRRYNAALVAASGAGLAVAERDITAEILTRLTTGQALATAADNIRREMLSMPAPATVVRQLEHLLSQGDR